MERFDKSTGAIKRQSNSPNRDVLPSVRLIVQTPFKGSCG